VVSVLAQLVGRRRKLKGSNQSVLRRTDGSALCPRGSLLVGLRRSGQNTNPASAAGRSRRSASPAARTATTGPGGLVDATYDAQDRLLTSGATSYTYTANGELATSTTASATTTYVYDTLGNLIQVTKPGGQVITYAVDGRGRRLRKAIDGVPVKGWLYADQLRPIAELDGSGAVVSRFVYGTKPNVPEYVVKSGQTYRIVSDHLGTPRVVVHATTGAVVQRFDVQPFGELIVDTNPGWQPFGFAGGLYDPDTGLLRFGARDYDPRTGRWTAKDPILFDANSTSIYEYVFQNPSNLVDPSGLIAPLAVVIPGVGGLINGGAEAVVAALAQCATAGSVAAAFGRGFVSGAGATAAGLLASGGGAGVLVAGAYGGFVGSTLKQSLAESSWSVTTFVLDTALGALGSRVAADLLPTKGFLPSLSKARGPSEFGKNSQRLVGREAVSGALGAATGLSMSAINAR
jgi:RHS repeat-associated protein